MPSSSDQEPVKNKRMVNCPECGVPVIESRLEKHIQKVHRNIHPETHRERKPTKLLLSPSRDLYAEDGGVIVNYRRWNKDHEEHSNRIIGHATSCPKERIYSHDFEDIKKAPNYYSKDQLEPKKAGKICLYLRVDKGRKEQRPMTREEITKKVKSLELPCTICGTPISPDNWTDHMKEDHPKNVINEARDKYLSQLVRCEGCSKIIKLGNIIAHLMDRSIHPVVGEIGLKIRNPKYGSSSRRISNRPPETSYQPGVSIGEAEKRRKELISRYLSIIDQKTLAESDDEPRDGSKNLGYISRENGKFGSYPLHDNYDDESDAD